jgi:hypothetical protein
MAGYWHYENAFGLRGQDYGEIAVSVTVAAVFLVLIPVMYMRSSREARRASRDMALLVGVLAFFGVIVDTLHIVVGAGYGEVIFGTAEDGGEMLAMSLACGYLFGLPKLHRPTAASFQQLTGRT